MEGKDLKTQIIGLVGLQKLDSEIYALNNEKSQAPAKIAEIETAFEAKKNTLAQLEKKSQELQKQRKEKELELVANEDNRKKLQTQLYSLKTNKEYQAMMQQIADAQADASVIEDKILLILEEQDRLKSQIEQEKKNLAEEEKLANAEKKKIQDRVREIEDRLAQLEAERKKVVENINPKLIQQYERILRNRDGLAIVPVKDNSCQGCNMFVPPQVINLIRMYERLITCEVCNRILYLEEDTL